MLNEQKTLIKQLSEIKLEGNNKKTFEICKKCLQVNNENKGGIVSKWLEQKKNIFKNYILTKIIVDTNLSIYNEELLLGGKINHSLKVLKSIDIVYLNINKKWIEEDMELFLTKILKAQSEDRQKNCEKEFFRFFNQEYEKKLFDVIIENFTSINNDILNDKIKDLNTRFISFAFIRRMTDCIYNKDISGLSTNAYFNKKMSMVFANSQRLIRNLFAYEFIKELELFKITNIPINEIIRKDDIFEYNYNENGNKIIIRFKPKKNGINSGFILDILKKDELKEIENILNSFYVKQYHGITEKCLKNFKEQDSGTFLYSSSLSFQASLGSYEKKGNREKRKFDLKEPFLYSLLNMLNFTPEVKFFINPYTINGFYIATKNLNDENNSFLSLSKISVETNINFLKESLNLIDFISRILRLGDLHNENFGFLVGKKQKIYKSLVIVDFSQPTYMESYKISSEKIKEEFKNCTYSGQKNEGIRILNIDDKDLDEKGKLMKNSFLKVEEKIRFTNGVKALKQFENRIETIELQQKNFSEMKKQVFKDEKNDDLLDEKFRYILNIQSQNIKNLMLKNRGIGNNPEENMLKHPMTKEPRTNAELIGFKLGKQPEIFEPSEHKLDYIDNAFEDLDNYCQSIMYNFKILKEFITDSYNKYYGK